MPVYVAADGNWRIDKTNVWLLRKDFFGLNGGKRCEMENFGRYFFTDIENVRFGKLVTFEKLFNVVIEIIIESCETVVHSWVERRMRKMS